MAAPLFNCTSCDKFWPARADAPERGGQCRLNPPTPVMVCVGAKKDAIGTIEPILHAQVLYPGVGKTEWCSHHPLARGVPLLGEANRFANLEEQRKAVMEPGNPAEQRRLAAERTLEASEANLAALNDPKGKA